MLWFIAGVVTGVAGFAIWGWLMWTKGGTDFGG